VINLCSSPKRTVTGQSDYVRVSDILITRRTE
jgi:hypothetical protein